MYIAKGNFFWRRRRDEGRLAQKMFRWRQKYSDLCMQIPSFLSIFKISLSSPLSKSASNGEGEREETKWQSFTIYIRRNCHQKPNEPRTDILDFSSSPLKSEEEEALSNIIPMCLQAIYTLAFASKALDDMRSARKCLSRECAR